MKFRVAGWLCLVWMVGVGTALTRTGLGLLGALRLVRKSSPVAATAPVFGAAAEAGRRLGVCRPLLIREGTPAAPVAVPMTFGGLHPTVLLPQGAQDWPAEKLRVVMMHETAHIKRRDWGTTLLAQLVCALYWFHPLVWLALRRLRAESEVACDDLVLAQGIAAPDYAGHLLDVVRGLVGRRVAPAFVTMAYSQEVKTRLTTILAERRNRGGVTVRGIALAAAAVGGLVVPIAVVRPVAAGAPILDTDAAAQSAGTDPRAAALLRRVQAATQAAHSMEADLTYTVQYPGQAATGIPGTATVKLMKPNYADVSLASSKWSPFADMTKSDGVTTRTALPTKDPHTVSYQTTPTLPDGGNIRVWDSIVVQAFFDTPKAVRDWIYIGNLGELSYAGTETIGGTEYRVLKHLMTGTLRGKNCPFMQRLYIGPDDLIHRYRLDFKYEGRPGVQIADLSNVRLNVAMAPADFALAPSPAVPMTPSNGAATGPSVEQGKGQVTDTKTGG